MGMNKNSDQSISKQEDFALGERNCCSKCSIEMSDEPEIEIDE